MSLHQQNWVLCNYRFILRLYGQGNTQAVVFGSKFHPIYMNTGEKPLFRKLRFTAVFINLYTC